MGDSVLLPEPLGPAMTVSVGRLRGVIDELTYNYTVLFTRCSGIEAHFEHPTVRVLSHESTGLVDEDDRHSGIEGSLASAQPGGGHLLQDFIRKDAFFRHVR